MTTKELIRREIERLEKMDYPVDTYEQSVGFYNALDRINAFLDTLPDEPVTDCHDLTEAAEAYSRQVSRGHNYRDLTCGFITGAEWQKAKMMEGATYNELMELYRAIRDELVKRHRDVPVNIKEEL